MPEWLGELRNYLEPDRVLAIIRALVLFAAGLLIARAVAGAVRRLVEKRLDLAQVQLIRKAVYYLILVLFLVAGLHQLGFNLGVLLGAAGILSVALGFASQTSASNIISGLFLIVERPFAVGDVVKVGGTTGEVLSIDLLAVKLRTFDNLYVRIPNETLIKSEVQTLTRFPLRRVDIQVGVAYDTDLDLVREVLLRVAERNPLALEDPRPLVIFVGFGDSSINFQFSVWGKIENFLELKNTIQVDLKKAFDDAGIEIPFPQRTLSVAGGSRLPVVLGDGGGSPEPKADASS